MVVGVIELRTSQPIHWAGSFLCQVFFFSGRTDLKLELETPAHSWNLGFSVSTDGFLFSSKVLLPPTRPQAVSYLHPLTNGRLSLLNDRFDDFYWTYAIHLLLGSLSSSSWVPSARRINIRRTKGRKTRSSRLPDYATCVCVLYIRVGVGSSSVAVAGVDGVDGSPPVCLWLLSK